MKPFSVNLAKFKKIAQDKKSTVLRDPSGHEIRVVHSALPALQRKQLEGLPMYAEGGGVSSEDAKIPSTKPVTVNVNQAPTTPSAAAQFAQQPVNPQVNPPAPASNLVARDQAADVPAAVNLEQKAIREQQAVDTAKGAQTANIEQGYTNQKAQIAQQEQDNVNAVKQHADEFAQHITAAPIDPSSYLESRTAGQKVLNAMGLILGGFKQGLVGGNNPAMDFINAQIDRDISAQKARADQQKNIYGAYRELYGDQQVATLAAKASMLDIYNHKMQQMAAQLGTPQAQANADAFAAKSVLERNQLLLDTAGRLGTLNMGPQVIGSSGAPAPGGPAQTTAQAAPAEDKPFYMKSPLQAGIDAISSGLGLNGASHAGEPQKNEDYYESHVLAPDAVEHFKRLAYTPKAKEDLAAIQHQYNNAVQADKALADINNTFSKLSAETGGLSGRVHRGINPHAIAGVGGAIGTGVGAMAGGIGALPGAGIGAAIGEGAGHAIQAITNTDKNRAYDSDKTALLGYVSSALKGTNIGSNQIQEVVDANAPEAGDTPELVGKKLKNIKEFILNHTDTSLLKTWGLSKR